METPAESAAKKLAWNLETQESVDLTVTTIIKAPGSDAAKSPVFNTFVEHYIGTATGQRFLEFQGVKGVTVVSRSTHYGDQGKFTDVNYVPNDTEKQQSVYITNHFFMEDKSDRKQLPPPLLFFHVGHKPLQEALPSAQYLGTGECIGRECDIFLFSQVRWSYPMDQVFYLDKQTAAPLKVEMYRDVASREKNQPASVWSAKSLDSVQGHDLSLKSSSTEYNKEGAPTFIWEHSVASVKFNQVIPSSTFQPVLQPGVTVLDSVTNKAYETSGVKPAPTADRAVVQVPSKSAQAIPPGDWPMTVSAGSLVLGLSFVSVGMVTWWRRR